MICIRDIDVDINMRIAVSMYHGAGIGTDICRTTNISLGTSTDIPAGIRTSWCVKRLEQW